MKRIAGVLLGMFVVLTACGGSSSALSKDEFVKQGNSICQKGNDAINSSGSTFFTSSEQPSPDQVKKFFTDVVVPNIKKQIDDLDKLKAPKDLQAQADKVVADARAALTKLQDEVNKDPEAALNSTEDPFADVNKEATAIGWTVCASDSENSSS